MSEPYIGEIRMFAGNFAPRNWAFADGQSLPIAQNTALFSLFGTTYGGDGRTTFNLPDLRGRSPIHDGQGPGLTPRVLGQVGGADSVTLAEVEMPNHTHTLFGNEEDGDENNPDGNTFARNNDVYRLPSGATLGAMASAITQGQGNGQAHDNLMPYIVVNFIVALQGIFPPN